MVTTAFKNYIFVILGVLGAIVTLLGIFEPNANPYHVVGSALLLLTAAYYRILFFIALEMILIAGHGAVLLDIGSKIQVALPLLLCIQLLFFYFFSGQIKNPLVLIGIAGIGALSVGFAYQNQWVFLIGGLAIATYAFFIAQKNKVALIWAILNVAFSFIAIYKLLY